MSPFRGKVNTRSVTDATWGLIALHIIQKTASAPYFIYATFEQYNNILTADGGSVEDVNGIVLQPSPSAATTPQVCLVDDQPKSGNEEAHVILTTDPETCAPASDATYCDSPGARLYYRNENKGHGPNSTRSSLRKHLRESARQRNSAVCDRCQ